MARGKATKELGEIFGVGEELDCFNDGVKRTVHPVTLKQFGKFMDNLAFVNTKEAWTNFLNKESEEAMKEVMCISFRVEDLEEILDNLVAKSFKIVIDKILEINEIDLSPSDEGDKKKA
jgi:hypothetical protein